MAKQDEKKIGKSTSNVKEKDFKSAEIEGEKLAKELTTEILECEACLQNLRAEQNKLESKAPRHFTGTDLVEKDRREGTNKF